MGNVARVLDARGSITINHEHVQRRVVVACNVQGRDLGRVVEDIQRELRPVEEKLRTLPGSYRIEAGGQFEAQKQANTLLFWLAWAVLLGVFLLLWKCLNSCVAAAIMLVINIPLAGLGSVVAMLLLNRPDPGALDAAAWWQWSKVWAGVAGAAGDGGGADWQGDPPSAGHRGDRGG